MALIKCPNCGKQISEKSFKCLYCGEEIQSTDIEKESYQAIS